MSTRFHTATNSFQRPRHWWPSAYSLAAMAAGSGEPAPLLGLEASKLSARKAQQKDERRCGRGRS